MEFICENCGHIGPPIVGRWEFYAKFGEMLRLCQAGVRERDGLFVAICDQTVGVEGHGNSEEGAVRDLQAQLGYPYLKTG